MNFVPNTKQEQEGMLKEVGISSIKELFKDIPEQVRINKLNLPKGLSELELKNYMLELSRKNKKLTCFLGAGSYNHFTPAIVSHLISRSEFYTAYTPYQPEISQGILQAIYEYQTMICELTGMDAANASMYDGASALAEACIMAANITRRKEMLISKTIHPEYRQTVKTYCNAHDFDYKEIDFSDGITSTDKLKNEISEKTAAVLLQNPNFFGCIEDLQKIENIVHENKAIFVVCVAEPTSLGLLKSPGSLNADIVVGEGQSFGNPMNFGGPYLGIIAAKKPYMRNVPGRIVGKTVDLDGKEGFMLTLQAREQHIRREKASSNICSNEALCALAATIHLVALGKNGVKEAAELSLQKSHYALEKLKENGCEEVFSKPFYNEFVVKVKDCRKVKEELLKNNILGGLDLGQYYDELKNCLLFCVTEMNTKEEIDKLVSIIKNQ
ncbi:aminomethyl-transferring glycine dehydrogenase subunit GcvPA [Candidatus Woesearchaeota archaeon]|nr:aminomethyl-transferring glycine dehydrogenase subunit GcvPA [Candidatus Woesearchaeota archaeon]